MAEKIIVKYGELWLKSEPVRKRFIRTLLGNAKGMMKDAGIKDAKIEKQRDMFTVDTSEGKKALEVLGKVSGISWFALAREVDSRISNIERMVREYSKGIGKGESFAIKVDRSDKEFSKTSMEMERMLGSGIDREVDLTRPDRTIHVEIRKGKSYVYTEKVRGLGGLPLSVSGRILCLMSGGIDSPVASWMMMKRGCFPLFIYFSSYPLVPKSDRENVIKVVRKLREFSPSPLTLINVPIVKIHEAVVNSCEPKYKCVIGRRIMYRIAERIAMEKGAKALLTGDSLAQVASQTLDNVRAEDDVLSVPVLKPLIGMDKEAIIRISKDIGTYGISTKIKSSCPLMARKPATKSDPERLEKEESRISGLEKIIQNGINESETIRI